MRPIALLTLTATLTTLSAATLPTTKTTEPVEISRLNECIQTRFQDRKSFGMNRIAIPRFHDGLRTFVPENPTEQALVEQMKKKGLEVATFLVGRLALKAPEFPTWRTGLQGPAFVTPAGALPDAAAIFAEGKKALATIGDGPGYDVKSAGWTVAMRPLRASNQGCISCHTTSASTPKLGDALGVVMYVYRQRE